MPRRTGARVGLPDVVAHAAAATLMTVVMSGCATGPSTDEVADAIEQEDTTCPCDRGVVVGSNDPVGDAVPEQYQLECGESGAYSGYPAYVYRRYKDRQTRDEALQQDVKDEFKCIGDTVVVHFGALEDRRVAMRICNRLDLNFSAPG